MAISSSVYTLIHKYKRIYLYSHNEEDYADSGKIKLHISSASLLLPALRMNRNTPCTV